MKKKNLVYFEVISFDTKRCIFLLSVITICQGTSFVFSSKKKGKEKILITVQSGSQTLGELCRPSTLYCRMCLR